MSRAFTVNVQTPVPLARSQSSLESVLSFAMDSPEPSNKETTEARLLYHLIVEGCKEDKVLLYTPSYEKEINHSLVSGRGSGSGDTTPEVPPPGAHGACDTTDYEIRLAEAGTHGGLPDVDKDYRDESSDDSDNVYLHKIYECIWEYCPTEAGRDNITRMVLIALFAQKSTDFHEHETRSLTTILPIARGYVGYRAQDRERVNNILKFLAIELLECFFVPLKAQGKCTPSVTSLISPTSRSEPGQLQGTSTRLYNLRKLILAREGNRCCVTGLHDSAVLIKMRSKISRQEARKRRWPKEMATEAAHIIPHALNMMDENGTLSEQKHTIWRVMNMFDPGISQMLEGSSIDTPGNAFLIVHQHHQLFGNLRAYFEEIEGEANTYNFRFIDILDEEGVIEDLRPKNPIIFRNNESTGTRSSLPAKRLLRIHRACCLILYMSGAGEYVDNVLGDIEELSLRRVLSADGSSNFGVFLRARGICEDTDGRSTEQWTQATNGTPVF